MLDDSVAPILQTSTIVKKIVEKAKAVFKELVTLTAGVLIALLIDGYSDKRQAQQYHATSLETVKKEIQANFADLETVFEQQLQLRDTIEHYLEDSTSMNALFEQAGGLKSASLSHTGLAFYSKNEIGLIDLKVMSALVQMNTLSEVIDIKMGKLVDFVYPNVFTHSRASKQLLLIYLTNVLESEQQLLDLYGEFIDQYLPDQSASNKAPK